MKLAFVSQPWASVIPPSESVAIWTVELARRLAAECDVTVYARGDPADDSRIDGVAYRFVSARIDWRVLRALTPISRVLPARRPLFAASVYHGAYWRGVAGDVERLRPDVVHVHNFAQALPLLRGARARALHMHCEWLSQLDPRLVDRRLRDAQLVTGCSEFVTARIREAHPEHAEKVKAIHNGVDPSAFRPGDHRAGGARILFVARLSPEKGPHVLLDAFRRVHEQRPHATLELVGPDGLVPLEMGPAIDHEPRVRALAAHYEGDYGESLRRSLPPDLAASVTFTGTVPHAEAPGRFAAADLFVLPSVWNEPFGMPLLEAMASGLPVVATRAGGIPEIVVEGETGLLVPPDDPGALAAALLQLLDDPDERRRLGTAGRQRAEERFTWDAVAATLLAYDHELTGSRAAG